MSINLPPALAASLPELRQQLDQARKIQAAAAKQIRDLTEVIELLTRLVETGENDTTPPVLVRDNQFSRMTVPDAMRQILTTSSQSFRPAELADIVFRGGQGRDLTKIRTNVGASLQYWKAKGFVERGERSQSWKLSAKGRNEFSGATIFNFDATSAAQ